MITADAVMLLWVHAIWSRNKKVLLVTATLFVAEIISVTVLLGIGFTGEENKPRIIPLIEKLHMPLTTDQPCAPFSLPMTFWKCWIPIATFEGILLGLTVFKAYQQYQEYLRRGKDRDGGSIREMLLKNSLLQVLAIFLAYLACCITWLTSEPDRTPDILGFAVVFSITMCCRLMLRIRDSFYNQEKVTPPETPHLRQAFGEDVHGRVRLSAPATTYTVSGPGLADDWQCELREMKPRTGNTNYELL